MHISKLSIVNYRNFPNAKLIFKEGINTIIGENGSGKTNLFRAIRLLLDDNMLRFANKLDERDFHRGLKRWQGHWIIISLEFDKVSHDEAVQSLFLHGTGNITEGIVDRATYNLIFRPSIEIRQRLSLLPPGDHVGLSAIQDQITIEDYETLFTGKSDADFNDPEVYRTVVGDFENVLFSEELSPSAIGGRVPPIFSLSKEISFTFIQALRDVVADFQNNRTNPLMTLLKRKSGEIDPQVFAPIAKQVEKLNADIASLPDVQTVRTDISATIKDTAGETYAPTSLSIKSELSDEAEKLFQSLKLFVGEAEPGYEGAIHELSLGGANLIYLTLKLLEFKYQKSKQPVANFLLIEEPEAHIHTHIQKTLFDRLSYPDTQIIYSTHSTHISEVCNVRNMNILGKRMGRCEAYQPTEGLSDPDVTNIQRYLDAVRSNLLFAKSVLLVEGDAEEILIPILVKKVFGVSLDELGISLVNIRSTGFQNVAVLFHDTRIRKKCSIVTDLDAAFVDTTILPMDSDATKRFKTRCLRSQETGIARKAALEAFKEENEWIGLSFAPHTFEVDFAAKNIDPVIATLGTIYSDPGTIATAKAELESKDVALYGRRVLTMAQQAGKGWYAILVGNQVGYQAFIPDYILDAILFGTTIGTELWVKILRYRLACIEKAATNPPSSTEVMHGMVDALEFGLVNMADVKNQMLLDFASDGINAVLKRF